MLYFLIFFLIFEGIVIELDLPLKTVWSANTYCTVTLIQGLLASAPFTVWRYLNEASLFLSGCGSEHLRLWKQLIFYYKATFVSFLYLYQASFTLATGAGETCLGLSFPWICPISHSIYFHRPHHTCCLSAHQHTVVHSLCEVFFCICSSFSVSAAAVCVCVFFLFFLSKWSLSLASFRTCVSAILGLVLHLGPHHSRYTQKELCRTIKCFIFPWTKTDYYTACFCTHISALYFKWLAST